MIWSKHQYSNRNYSFFLTKLLKKVSFPVLSYAVVRPALVGDKVALDLSPIPGKTYRELIADGVYINVLSIQKKKFIPLLSPIQLIKWANDHEPGRQKAKSTEEQVAYCILQMLQLEANFGWKEYEKFHAQWEVMIRYLLGGESWSLMEIYANAIYSQKFVDMDWTLTPKSQGVIRLDHHFAVTARNPIEGAFSFVFLPANGNPGFDALIFEQGLSKKSFALCVECRFSGVDSSTLLSLDDVTCKRNLMVREFKDFLAKPKTKKTPSLCEQSLGSSLTEEDLYLVVCAYRQLKADITAADLPANVVVLDRQTLDCLYSPSLCFRPQFIFSE